MCLVLLLLSGCATTRTPRSLEWTCDTAADAAVTEGRWEDALAAHEALLEKDPDNCLTRYHLGYILGRLGHRDAEIDHYRRAIACGYTRDDRLYFNLGMALGDQGDMDGALTAFDRAVAIAPRNADNHFGKGLIARAADQDEQAEKALRKAVRLSPRHWDARLLLARVYLDQCRWAQARRQLDMVLKEEPRHPEALQLWETMITRQREAYD